MGFATGLISFSSFLDVYRQANSNFVVIRVGQTLNYSHMYICTDYLPDHGIVVGQTRNYEARIEFICVVHVPIA